MPTPFIAPRRGGLLILSLLLVIGLAACGGGDTGGGGDGGSPGATATVENGSVEVTADDLAFNVDVIEAPAGEGFTVVFRNLEAIPHNWSIYTEQGGEAIAVGDVIGEGETNEVTVPALDAGTYFFVCDVHASEMTGTVVVEG